MAHAEAADASGLGTCTYTYDANGNVTTKVLGNGCFTYVAYDAADRLTSVKNSLADGSAFAYFEYGYDAASRIVECRRESGMVAA